MHVGRHHQQSMDVHLWGQPVVGARAMDYDTLLLDDNRRLWWKTMTVDAGKMKFKLVELVNPEEKRARTCQDFFLSCASSPAAK